MLRHLLAALLLASSARAAVIYSGLQNIALPFNMSGVYVNVFTNGTSLTSPGDYDSEPWMFFSFGGSGIGTSPLVRTVVTGPVIAGQEQTENLAYGSEVGPSSRFAIGDSGYNGSETHVGPAINQFQLGTQAYIGYEFEPTVGGPSYFAVMRLTIANDGASAFIHDWSYDNVGTPVSVPEPGRVALLLGGLLLAALRSSRSRR